MLIWLTMEEMLITLPPSLKWGRASRVVCSRPQTLVPNWRWNSASVTSAMGTKL